MANFTKEEVEDVIFKLKLDVEIIKNLIIHEIPFSLELLNKKDWTTISQKYSAKTEQVLRNQQLQSYCIIDYIIGTKHPDVIFAEKCNSMVKTINGEINKALGFVKSNPKHKDIINNIIVNILTSMDVNIQSNNSDFKNWVNELFVFNKLTTNPAYTLIELERKLSTYDNSNKKRVDYVFKHNETHKELLVDVVTFQRIDPSKHKTAKSFNTFINQRIQTKYDSKLGTSTNISRFRVLPIIEYQDGMEKFTIKVDMNISLPALTICRNEVENREEIVLLEINSFLKQIRKQKKWWFRIIQRFLCYFLPRIGSPKKVVGQEFRPV